MENPPSTPDDRFFPSGPSSTVLRRSGRPSFDSKDEQNVRAADGLWSRSPLSGDRPAAGTIMINSGEAAIDAVATAVSPMRSMSGPHAERYFPQAHPGNVVTSMRMVRE
ncbi:hypothetical protein ACFW5D_13695 [Streptomyces sp. NPDC058770]|uniref:hypothetical protein n=1 Tax=unclassified Streptomyces TaxID=2593676 RepID=UPI0036B70AAE